MTIGIGPSKPHGISTPWILCAIAAVVILVFWQQFLGLGVFIGESDRLNSYLNVRLWEYDALSRLHRVPGWSNTMFGGFPTSALHWMNPGTDPIAPLLQLFPRESIFRVLGYVSLAFVVAACWAGYLYFRELVDDQIVAGLGGVVYGLSVISLHRSAQVDNAHLTIVLLPVAFLAVRQSERMLKSFILLATAMTMLAFWGFLQEVAYAFLFIGAYVLYRAGVLWRLDKFKSLDLIVMFASASAISIMFALPRLLTVAKETFLVARTSTMQYYGYPELLRFFHEGIYGRFFEENRLVLGNGMNLHEGLQLTSSTAVAAIIFLGVVRPRNRVETFAGALFCALFLPLIYTLNISHDIGKINQLTVMIAFWTVAILVGVALLRRAEPYLGLQPQLGKLLPDVPRPQDTNFHLFASIALLFTIVDLDGYRVIYRLFGRADFTHSRLSTVVVLSLCALFCVYLNELKFLPIFQQAGEFVRRPGRATMAGVVFAIGLMAWLLCGPIGDLVFAHSHRAPVMYGGYFLANIVVFRTVLTFFVILAIGLIILYGARVNYDLRKAGALAIAAWTLIEVTTYAHLKVGGPQTWTFPYPFRGFNYMNVAPSVLRPPSKSELDGFASALETDKYRAVLSGGNIKFEGAKTASISSLWQMNSIGGYGTGVPNRLAMLPWPTGVQTLRTIEFQPGQQLNPAVLALLNVKYFVELNPDLYFNVAGADKDASSAAPSQENVIEKNIEGRNIRYVENPVPPLPRHFLAASVVGLDTYPTFEPTGSKARDRSDRGGVIFGDDLQGLLKQSFAEGMVGTEDFDADGPLNVTYDDDEINIRVSPSNRDRFVVLNMRFHPDWRIKLDRRDARPFPTNIAMMGVRLVAGTTEAKLKFQPLSSRLPARFIMVFAFLCFVGMIVMLLRRRDGLGLSAHYFAQWRATKEAPEST
jgi:hypothetical protein